MKKLIISAALPAGHSIFTPQVTDTVTLTITRNCVLSLRVLDTYGTGRLVLPDKPDTRD